MALRTVSLDELTIDDERSLAGVALYARLKRALTKGGHRFHVPDARTSVSWDRALFLNLTYWSATEGADVLQEPRIAADVVAHAAWHHVANDRLARLTGQSRPCVEAMLLSESIASAFDLYLVGRLLVSHPDSEFVTSQVPIMAECAEVAGLSDAGFEALMESVADDPERAFGELRALLYDASVALFACGDGPSAQRVLEGFEAHRFAALLHHYQLSNWILYGRAYGAPNAEASRAVGAVHEALKSAPDAIAWLDREWLEPLV